MTNKMVFLKKDWLKWLKTRKIWYRQTYKLLISLNSMLQNVHKIVHVIEYKIQSTDINVTGVVKLSLYSNLQQTYT